MSEKPTEKPDYIISREPGEDGGEQMIISILNPMYTSNAPIFGEKAIGLIDDGNLNVAIHVGNTYFSNAGLRELIGIRNKITREHGTFSLHVLEDSHLFDVLNLTGLSDFFGVVVKPKRSK